MRQSESLKATLDEILRKYAAEGKRTFDLRSLFQDVGGNIKTLESTVIPYLLSGKMSARLKVRCPECGKDLGEFERISQIPDELQCQACGTTFPRETEYLDVICTLADIGFFREPSKTEEPLSKTQILTTNESITDALDKCLSTGDLALKGQLFEQFFESVVGRDGEFKIVSRHLRSQAGEIDYVLGHELQDNFWRKSPYVCVECKNWKKTIPIGQVDHFIAQVKKAGPYCAIGIYLTTSRLSPDSLAAIRDARINDRLTLVPIEGVELRKLVETKLSECVRMLFETKALR
jgi:ribosomal protein S27E